MNNELASLRKIKKLKEFSIKSNQRQTDKTQNNQLIEMLKWKIL